MKFFSCISALVAFAFVLPSDVDAQNGDKKEKDKDLLDSTNWRKWAPDPVPFLEPEETAKLSRWLLAFVLNWWLRLQ